MAIHGHDVGDVCREFVVDFYCSSAGFVKHCHFSSVAESGFMVHYHNVHVVDEHIVANRIVGDIVGHVADDAVVSHGDVVQSHVFQSGMHFHSALQRPSLLHVANFHYAGEIHISNKFGREIERNVDCVPVFGRAVLLLQPADFFTCKFTIFHIKTCVKYKIITILRAKLQKNGNIPQHFF